MYLIELFIEVYGYIKRFYSDNGGFSTMLLRLLWFFKHNFYDINLNIGLIPCHYRVKNQRVILYCQYIFNLVLLEYDQPLLEKRPTLQETIFRCD